MNVEINNQSKNKIDLFLVKTIGKKFLTAYKKKKFNISIAFVGDKRIRDLNKKYRGIDKTTDILSFAGEDNFLGELIINFNQVKRQAKKLGNKPKDELAFVLTHGLLHLSGYNDRTEAGEKKMEKLSNKFVKSVKK